MKKWTSYLVSLGLVFCLTPYSVKAEELANSNLPSTPDTGSPEEDFSAGGTRDNHLLTQVCDRADQQIAYLLGSNNREFTVSPHPTFWFIIPNSLDSAKEIKFVLRELKTGNKVYSKVLRVPLKADTVGISIPREQKYALVPNVNYSWSLEIDCLERNEQSIVTLEGWLRRLPLDSQLQRQLATVEKENKYRVYLENNLLYDALHDLARQRIDGPNTPHLTTAWERLLTELGWRNLAKQSTAKFYLLDTRISNNRK